MSDNPENLKHIDLLLVGRTGNGKSSTGNSILGEKKFTPRSASSSVVVEIKGESVERDGYTIKVVDGPGIGDTGSDAPQDGQTIIDLVDEAMKLSDFKFTALVVVFKYGTRFTKQEKDAVAQIKAIFGEDVLKKFGVIVMTHGDSFELDMEDEGISFEDWCKDQTGDVQALFQECGSRFILFNNKSKDEAQKKEQVDKLLSLVASVHSAQKRSYTKDDFDAAVMGRNRVLVQMIMPKLEKETDVFLDDVKERLDKAVGGRSGDGGNLKEMENIMKEVQRFREHLEEKDGGTNSLGQLFLQISVTETSIRSKMELARRVIENQKKQEDLRRVAEERKGASVKEERQPSKSEPESEPKNPKFWNLKWVVGISIGCGVAYIAYRNRDYLLRVFRIRS